MNKQNFFKGYLKIRTIHIASKCGYLSEVKRFVENNPALIEQIDDFDNTPMYYAALCGHKEIVEYFLSKGAIDHDERGYISGLNEEIRALLKPNRKQPVIVEVNGINRDSAIMKMKPNEVLKSIKEDIMTYSDIEFKRLCGNMVETKQPFIPQSDMVIEFTLNGRSLKVPCHRNIIIMGTKQAQKLFHIDNEELSLKQMEKNYSTYCSKYEKEDGLSTILHVHIDELLGFQIPFNFQMVNTFFDLLYNGHSGTIKSDIIAYLKNHVGKRDKVDKKVVDCIQLDPLSNMNSDDREALYKTYNDQLWMGESNNKKMVELILSVMLLQTLGFYHHGLSVIKKTLALFSNYIKKSPIHDYFLSLQQKQIKETQGSFKTVVAKLYMTQDEVLKPNFLKSHQNRLQFLLYDCEFIFNHEGSPLFYSFKWFTSLRSMFFLKLLDSWWVNNLDANNELYTPLSTIEDESSIFDDPSSLEENDFSSFLTPTTRGSKKGYTLRKQRTSIQLSDIFSRDLYVKIIEFMYKSKISLNMENVVDIFLASEYFMIDALTEKVVTFLSKLMDDELLLDILYVIEQVVTDKETTPMRKVLQSYFDNLTSNDLRKRLITPRFHLDVNEHYQKKYDVPLADDIMKDLSDMRLAAIPGKQDCELCLTSVPPYERVKCPLPNCSTYCQGCLVFFHFYHQQYMGRRQQKPTNFNYCIRCDSSYYRWTPSVDHSEDFNSNYYKYADIVHHRNIYRKYTGPL